LNGVGKAKCLGGAVLAHSSSFSFGTSKIALDINLGFQILSDIQVLSDIGGARLAEVEPPSTVASDVSM
jgi:hypothetical protein